MVCNYDPTFIYAFRPFWVIFFLPYPKVNSLRSERGEVKSFVGTTGVW